MSNKKDTKKTSSSRKEQNGNKRPNINGDAVTVSSRKARKAFINTVLATAASSAIFGAGAGAIAHAKVSAPVNMERISSEQAERIIEEIDDLPKICKIIFIDEYNRCYGTDYTVDNVDSMEIKHANVNGTNVVHFNNYSVIEENVATGKGSYIKTVIKPSNEPTITIYWTRDKEKGPRIAITSKQLTDNGQPELDEFNTDVLKDLYYLIANGLTGSEPENEEYAKEFKKQLREYLFKKNQELLENTFTQDWDNYIQQTVGPGIKVDISTSEEPQI